MAHLGKNRQASKAGRHSPAGMQAQAARRRQSHLNRRVQAGGWQARGQVSWQDGREAGTGGQAQAVKHTQGGKRRQAGGYRQAGTCRLAQTGRQRQARTSEQAQDDRQRQAGTGRQEQSIRHRQGGTRNHGQAQTGRHMLGCVEFPLISQIETIGCGKVATSNEKQNPKRNFEIG